MPFCQKLFSKVCLTITECKVLQANKEQELENDRKLLQRVFANKNRGENALAAKAAKRVNSKTPPRKSRKEKETEALMSQYAGLIPALQSKIERMEQELQLLEMYISDLRNVCFSMLLPEIMPNLIQNAIIATAVMCASQVAPLSYFLENSYTLFKITEQSKIQKPLSESEQGETQQPPSSPRPH